MHDIDQVALEDSPQAPAYEQYEPEDEEYLEFSDEQEAGGETAFEDEAAYQDEHEHAETGEAAELELAAELFEVTDEQELEHFIGDLLRSASGGMSDFARTREGRQIGGILKQAAGRVLPVVGRATGRAAGSVARATARPQGRYQRNGEKVGSSLSSLAKRGFGLELEGSSPEDQEFEIARRFVRFANEAIRNSLRRLGTGPAHQITRQATVAAAQRWAPGLVTEWMLDAAPLPRWTAAPVHRTPSPTPSAAQPGPTRTCPSCGNAPLAARGGRWERRGNTIVLFIS